MPSGTGLLPPDTGILPPVREVVSLSDPDVAPERAALARENALPLEAMMNLSKTYVDIAEKITNKKLTISENPKQEIIDILDQEYGLIIKE